MSFPLSNRTVLNVNFPQFLHDYRFINRVLAYGVGPIGSGWNAAPFWTRSMLDANGWPSDPSATGLNGRFFGGAVDIPTSSEFSGPYVFWWDGDGTLDFPNSNTVTFTVDTGLSHNYTQVANGRYSGNGGYVVATLSGWGGGSTFTWRFIASTVGNPARNFRFYRLDDESDLLAGKIYRRPYKQPIVNMCPSAIRFMNWMGGNASPNCRWETRRTPIDLSAQNNVLPYGQTSGTNQYTLAGVAGTPGSMVHGEVVQCSIGNGMVRCGAGSLTILGVTKANPGVVNVTAHGFNNGDKIIHQVFSGMVELNNIPCTITVVDADHYSIGIDTTAFSTFIVNANTNFANQYITLNVGGRGDFPVIFGDAKTPASAFGNAYMAAGDGKYFIFNKNCICSTSVNGAWIFSGLGFVLWNPDVSVETCTKLIVELNEMSPRSPINMWVNVPYLALMPNIDPDYSTASDYSVNLMNTILNGANGYPGLPAQCYVIVEVSNELWNSGFGQTQFYGRMGQIRYGGGNADFSSYATLRAVLNQQNLKANFTDLRIKYVLAGQGFGGYSVGNPNWFRINGSTNVLTDALYPAGGHPPIFFFDAWAWASYFDPNVTFYNANIASLAAQWVSHAGNDAAQEADCAIFVNNVLNDATSTEQTIANYVQNILPMWVNALKGFSKQTVNYEGGQDWAITGGSITTDESNYLLACTRSQAWANALVSYFNACLSLSPTMAMPSVYVEIQGDGRWAFATGDTYG